MRVSSLLDYSNALYSCLSQHAVTQLLLVQNSAARLLTKTSYCSHVTPVLMSLHWILIKFRIRFKILLLIYKVLNGLAPEYISELLLPIACPLPANCTSFKTENTWGLCVCCPGSQAVKQSPSGSQVGKLSWVFFS